MPLLVATCQVWKFRPGGPTAVPLAPAAECGMCSAHYEEPLVGASVAQHVV